MGGKGKCEKRKKKKKREEKRNERRGSCALDLIYPLLHHPASLLAQN